MTNIQSSYIFILVFAVVASGMAGCTMPYKTLEPHPGPNVSSNFDGVKQLLKHEVANERVNHKPEVDVVLVHGMCTHNEDWATSSLTQFAKALGITKKLKIEPKIIPEGSNAEIYKAVTEVGGGTVRLSAIVWTPIIYPLKGKLCYDQKKKSKLCNTLARNGSIEEKLYLPDRVWINSRAKDVLLDDCLPDAVIYQGRAKKEISEQLQNALLAAVAPSTKPITRAEALAIAEKRGGIPLVLITESLGSKMTLDAVQQLAMGKTGKDTITAGYVTFKRTAKIFMAANQTPLLQLADLNLRGQMQFDMLLLRKFSSHLPDQGFFDSLDYKTVSSDAAATAAVAEVAPADRDGFYSDPLEVLYNSIGKSEAQGRKDGNTRLYSRMITPQEKEFDPLVVALSDPNDLLSYSLVGARLVEPALPDKSALGESHQNQDPSLTPSYPLFDFIVSNDWGYLGLVENPYAAHTSYLAQPNIMKLIACGTQPKDCE
jgi:hypothetical protein